MDREDRAVRSGSCWEDVTAADQSRDRGWFHVIIWWEGEGGFVRTISISFSIHYKYTIFPRYHSELDQ